MKQPTQRLTAVALVALLGAGCAGSANPDTADSTPAPAEGSSTTVSAIRLVTAQEGAALQSAPPDDLVILDVRTPEEFSEGHLDEAILVDFYDDNFTDQLAGLDPSVPYLLYCRSGNRSGQTATIMEELGFVDVADVDGGIIAWNDAGLPTVVE